MLLLCSLVCRPERSDPAWTRTATAQEGRTIFARCSRTSILIFHDTRFLSRVGVLTRTPITTAWEVANEILGFQWDTNHPDLKSKLIPPKKNGHLVWDEKSLKQDKHTSIRTRVFSRRRKSVHQRLIAPRRIQISSNDLTSRMYLLKQTGNTPFLILQYTC